MSTEFPGKKLIFRIHYEITEITAFDENRGFRDFRDFSNDCTYCK